jgi:hypothetical protein
LPSTVLVLDKHNTVLFFLRLVLFCSLELSLERLE